jgi:hypothetical protein
MRTGVAHIGAKTTGVDQLFERRHVAGAAPNAFLKARENAASESQPTVWAIWAREALVFRSF